jgi:hypothetical protein
MRLVYAMRYMFMVAVPPILSPRSGRLSIRSASGQVQRDQWDRPEDEERELAVGDSTRVCSHRSRVRRR